MKERERERRLAGQTDNAKRKAKKTNEITDKETGIGTDENKETKSKRRKDNKKTKERRN